MKYLLIFSINYFIVLSTYGQGLINSTSKWYVVSGDIQDGWTRVSKYEVFGDTLINNDEYMEIKEVYNEIRYRFSTTDTISYKTGLIAYHYIKEEDNKLYKWNYNNIYEQERLIIDFNLELGQVIEYAWPNPIVIEIDSIKIGDGYRKIFHTDNQFEIYEGIGTNIGFIRGLNRSPGEGYSYLKCYAQDDEIYTLNQGGWGVEAIFVENCEDFTKSSAFPITGISDRNNNAVINLSPNPTSSHLTIGLANYIGETVQIELMNLEGEVVHTMSYINNGEQQINISFLNMGAYIVSVKVKDNISFGKIMKI